MYILGIDGGATKTTAQIASEKGEVLGTASAGPANLQLQSTGDFKRNVGEAILGAILGAELDDPVFEAVCFGGAGLDNEMQIEDARELLNDVIKIKDAKRFLVVNDIKLVRPACSDISYGISIIAGTGSNFYGINKKGNEAYVGGLGQLLADEGSGYWIARQVFQAAVKSADGRGEKTLLEELLLGQFKAKNMRELVDSVYREGFDKAAIADAGIIVDEAYSHDDAIAKTILESAAAEIALSVNTIITQLNMNNDKEFDIIAVGGIFHSPFPFNKQIPNKINHKNAEFIICDNEPVGGAVRLAQQLIT